MLIASTTASAKDQAPSEPSPYELTEAQRQDLGVMAAEAGISLEEAIDRYAWHEPFAFMVNDIREAFPHEFAGGRIEANAGNRAWVAFRGDAPQAALDMIEAFPEKVSVKTNRGFTEKALDERLETVHYSVWGQRDVVHDASSAYDLATGVISVEVEGRGRMNEQARQRLETTLRDRLPSQARAWIVDLEVTSGVDYGEDTVYGGVPIIGCTTGYTVTFNGGSRGISTAAHCDNSQTYDGRLSMNFVDAHKGTWGDVQYHTTSEHEEDDFYYNSGVRRDVDARGFRTEGQQLCKYGKTTGATCDEVYQLNHCNGDTCHLTAMHNRKADGGDSGGPWYYGNTAYGIHQGYKWWSFKNRDLFTPATYLDEALNIHVALS